MGRAWTRLALRRLRREHPDRRSEINEILRDPDLLEAMEDELRLESQIVQGSKTEGMVDWFNWLIENYEKVFKIIQLLLVMFSGQGKGGSS